MLSEARRRGNRTSVRPPESLDQAGPCAATCGSGDGPRAAVASSVRRRPRNSISSLLFDSGLCDMSSCWRSFALSTVLVAAINAHGAAQRYPALVGLDSVRVSIGIDAEGVKAYIDSVAMRTTVELDLRRAGLIV